MIEHVKNNNIISDITSSIRFKPARGLLAVTCIFYSFSIFYLTQPFFWPPAEKKLKAKKLKNSKTQGKKLKLKPNNKFYGIIRPKKSQNLLAVVILQAKFSLILKITLKTQWKLPKTQEFCKNSRSKTQFPAFPKYFEIRKVAKKKGWVIALFIIV